jgi:uncharacterized protein (TIGR00730 family)
VTQAPRVFRRICVYCGSSDAVIPRYGWAAHDVGRSLAQRGIGVVYGGGSVGLMGRVADGALAAGGEVIGVIPERLQALELGHRGLTELVVVGTMHERKATMATLADAFLALPGGWGTWEEVLEATTWTQLGYHSKPVGVLDLDGYYQPLEQLLTRAVDEGFVRESQRDLLLFDDDLDRLLARMAEVELPDITRWMTAP